jgi:hypothetical protein
METIDQAAARAVLDALPGASTAISSVPWELLESEVVYKITQKLMVAHAMAARYPAGSEITVVAATCAREALTAADDFMSLLFRDPETAYSLSDLSGAAISGWEKTRIALSMESRT